MIYGETQLLELCEVRAGDIAIWARTGPEETTRFIAELVSVELLSPMADGSFIVVGNSEQLDKIAEQKAKSSSGGKAGGKGRRRIARGQPEANDRLTTGQPEANDRLTTGQPEANDRLTTGQPEANDRLTTGQPEANDRLTTGQPEANDRLTTGQPEVSPRARTRLHTRNNTSPFNPPSRRELNRQADNAALEALGALHRNAVGGSEVPAAAAALAAAKYGSWERTRQAFANAADHGDLQAFEHGLRRDFRAAAAKHLLLPDREAH